MGTVFTQKAVVAERPQKTRGAFGGEIILPGDRGYEEARKVWNGMIDRRPALIVRPVSTADVVWAVNYARDYGLLLSVRGGGHNVAGHATNDGGMVIDLAKLNQVHVDPVQRVVRAGGGATIGDLDAETQKHELVVPMGVVSETGIAGLTLGGGFGWLRNKYGLASDNLIGAQVVTADGSIVYAGEDENFDLLWGLRGGGGNFGIVTEFVYRAYPLGPEVFMAFAFHDARGDRLRKAIEFYRDFTAVAPDEVSTLLSAGIVPPTEHFPEAIHHTPFVALAGMYAGAVEEGRNALSPLIEFGEPLVDLSGAVPYVKAQTYFDEDYPNGMRYYWKSLNLSRLDDQAIDRFVEHARRQPSVLSTVDLWDIGGAVARLRADESAFFGRQAAFLLNPEANWEDKADDAANVAWVRDFIDDMQPFSDGSRYLNFAGFQEEGDALVRDAFGAQYARLAALKAKYDPHNLFRLNQNVKPALQFR